jgi:phage portal protein BeeE
MINWFKNLIGKSMGLPNLDPTFFHSNIYSGGLGPNKIASNPGVNHTWVYAAVSTIVNSYIRAYPAIHFKGDEKSMNYGHPLIKLMKKPNPYMSGMNLFEAILWSLLLPTARTPGGQCFIVGNIPTKFGKGEIPQELWAFSDLNFYPIHDRTKMLVGWEYKVAGVQSVRYELDEVIRIHLFNKDNLELGLSPLCAALSAVSQDSKATEFNSRFLDNFANPGGIISMQNQVNPSQIEDFKKQWKEHMAGVQNSGKLLALPFAVKFEQMARSHQEFQFMEQLNWNQAQILAAYHLNKFNIGLEAGQNRATAYEQDKQIWNNAINPVETAIVESLNAQWIDQVKGNIQFAVDKSNIETLKEDRALRIDDALKLVEIGVPPKAAFDYLELQIDTSEYPWLSENQSTTAKLAFPDEPSQANAAPPKTPPKKALEIEIIRSLPAPEAIYREVSVLADETDKLSGLFIEKMFSPGEKSIKAPVVQFFIKQRNAFQDQVDEVIGALKEQSIVSLKVSDFLIPQAKQDKAIANVFKPLYKSIGDRVLGITEVEVTEQKILKALNQDSAAKEISGFLKNRLQFIAKVNDTSFAEVEKRLASILARAIKENLSPRDIAKKIKEGIASVYKSRVADTITIARTESAVVANTIRYNVFSNLDAPAFHTWLSAQDEDVRHNHKSENGHTVKVGKRFPVTKLLHPSDPNGPAKEVVNCRCVAILKARGRNA